MPDHALSSSHRPRLRDLARWLIGIGIGAIAVVVAVSVAGGFAGAATALRRLDRRWLIPAMLVEAASYVLLGTKLRRLIGADAVGRMEAMGLGLVVSGFGLLTPASPAEGLAICGAHLRRRGLTRRRIVMVFGFSEWFSTRMFLLIASLNLLAVVAIERDPLSDLWPFVAAAVAVLMMLLVTARLTTQPSALATVSAFIGWFHRPSRRPPIEERRERGAAWHRDALEIVGPTRKRAVLALLTATGILADVGCLWFALRAAHAHVGFDVALLAVTVSSVSVLVPLVPGGLGIVEAAIPAITHHFGVPFEQGLAAAIVYRSFSTFLPAGMGTLSIVALRLR